LATSLSAFDFPRPFYAGRGFASSPERTNAKKCTNGPIGP
jgi:hypothetical protein